MNNVKTALLVPDEPDSFHLQKILLRINKERNNKSELEIEPLYIQGVLYSIKKEY